MLYIDDKNLEITEQKIFVGEYIKNRNKGYNVKIELLFINNDNKTTGYINLDVGFEKDNNINLFLNKEYKGVPFEDDIFFEVFDSEKFLDTEIENNIIIKFKEMKNNEIPTFLELNDKLIKIKFNGILKFDCTKIKSNC